MLGSISMLAPLGLRYLLRMLPRLLFEVAWKLVWLLRVALAAWMASKFDDATAETGMKCLMGVMIVLVIP